MRAIARSVPRHHGACCFHALPDHRVVNLALDLEVTIEVTLGQPDFLGDVGEGGRFESALVAAPIGGLHELPDFVRTHASSV